MNAFTGWVAFWFELVLALGSYQVLLALKKRRSTSQTQSQPGPSRLQWGLIPYLNQTLIASQSQPPSENPSPLERVSERRYVYGFRVWIPRWEESDPYWDVTGKTIIDIRNVRLMPVAGAGWDWQPGVNHARCNFTEHHSAPHEGCQCGFWMLDKLEDAIQRARGMVVNWGGVNAPMIPSPHGESGIVGSVVAWGKLIRHGAGANQYETGWRAEKVYIVAFLDPDIQITESNIISAMHGHLRKKAYVLKALSERYDVPILNRVEIEEFTRSYAEETWRPNEKID